MSKFKIYLAGAMGSGKYGLLTIEEMNNWRKTATQLFSTNPEVKTLNPCDFYSFERDRSTYTEREVKKFDLYLVKHCNLVLVDLNHPDSIGTAIELNFAEEWGIPVVGFGFAKNHPWIETAVDKKCGTLEDAVDYIREFYLSSW